MKLEYKNIQDCRNAVDAHLANEPPIKYPNDKSWVLHRETIVATALRNIACGAHGPTWAKELLRMYRD